MGDGIYIHDSHVDLINAERERERARQTGIMHTLPLLTLLTATAALPQQHPLSSLSNLIPSLHPNNDNELCPLAPKVSPPNDGLHDSLHFLHDAKVRETQARRLSRAVQVPTTVSDFMTDPYDEGFEVFVRFQELLAEMFPLVYVLHLPTHLGYTDN